FSGSAATAGFPVSESPAAVSPAGAAGVVVSWAADPDGWTWPAVTAVPVPGRVWTGWVVAPLPPGTAGGASDDVLAPMVTVVTRAALAAVTFAAVAHVRADAPVPVVTPDEASYLVADSHCETIGTPR